MILPLINLERLRTFYISAKTGKFTMAAQQLGLDNSAVTRQIQSLEKDFKCLLFKRGGMKGLYLTEKGRVLQKLAHELFLKASEIELAFQEADESLEGSLRILIQGGESLCFVQNCLKGFAGKYPKISLDILSSQGGRSISCQEADVIVGPFLEDEKDFVVKPLFKYSLKLYAAKKYIQEYGSPSTPEDLEEHKLISLLTDNTREDRHFNWFLYSSSDHIIKPYLKLMSSGVQMPLIQEGLGIGALVPFLVRDQSENLIEVLPQFPSSELTIFVGYEFYFRNSKKIQAFSRFLEEQAESFRTKD